MKSGAVAKVTDCPNGYPLPVGLKSGDTVTILSFDRGYYTVEKAARTFTIFIVNAAP